MSIYFSNSFKHTKTSVLFFYMYKKTKSKKYSRFVYDMPLFFRTLFFNVIPKNNKYFFYKKPIYWHINGSRFSKMLRLNNFFNIKNFIMCYRFVSFFFKINIDYFIIKSLYSLRVPIGDMILFRFYKTNRVFKYRKYRRVKRWLYKSFLRSQKRSRR